MGEAGGGEAAWRPTQPFSPYSLHQLCRRTRIIHGVFLFSKAIRNPYAAKIRAPKRVAQDLPDGETFAPLTKAQLREIDRRVRDSDDRARFLIASVMSPRFVLYYDVSHDVYAMNEPQAATLFKRSQAARAVMELLGGRCRVLKCRVNRAGKLVKSSLSLDTTGRRAAPANGG